MSPSRVLVPPLRHTFFSLVIIHSFSKCSPSKCGIIRPALGAADSGFMTCHVAMNYATICKTTINIIVLTAPTMCQEHWDNFMHGCSLHKNPSRSGLQSRR